MATLKGAKELRAKLQRIKREAPKEFGRALYQEALVEMKESMRRTPVGPAGGPLRASHVTLPPEYKGNDISVSIQVGGPSIDYVIAVHEHLSEHSPPSWQHLGPDEIDWNVPGTGPKFLESTILESSPHMAPRIARRIELARVAG
jgi:hypothetical protein